MSDIKERKRKLSELLAYAKKTSWRRKSLEKRIGEIVSYLTVSVEWFSIKYSDKQKRFLFSAYSTLFTDVRYLGVDVCFTSYYINKAIVSFIEQLLDDLQDYENTER